MPKRSRNIAPSSPPSCPTSTGRAKVFGEFVEHHAKEEEKTMFKMAREMFSAEERADLDVQYEAWKNSGAGQSAVAKAAAETGAAGVMGQATN